MITLKVAMASKGVAKVRLRKRFKVHKGKQVGNVFREAATKKDVKAKLQRIEGMLGELEDEVIKQAAMVGIQVHEGINAKMDPSEEQMISAERINVLDHDIDSLFDEAQNRISTLRHSLQVEKQMGLLRGRYIDVGSFSNDL